ncbi:hypothetical protein BDM02DRAFT_3009363 [Thelephora ganbajun]|uniref:Uncharacterized protein n=1 Tax=Thelephora ganbajun TaxID=370292 RepID=A0ACB6ZAH0_THEGA|nr:hypothetical protein BDM02DRAFT_3009363 [Thelephora ganbajun]
MPLPPQFDVYGDQLQDSSGHENVLSSIMGPEINIDHIRYLDKKIEEGAGDIIQLKRTRNSLLNISARVPPEILGSIFRWRIVPDDDRPPSLSSRGGSYNFLRVCHHWFEVASRTPELWSYWGSTLKQWSQRYKRFGTTPVDLTLSGYNIYDPNSPFDGPLRDALRDRAEHDGIRSLHLMSNRTILAFILSTLTFDGEDVRCSSIESISLQCVGDFDVDVSNFFARYRFPKLRYLHLSEEVQVSR